jgi:hypothetical protein
MIHQAARDVLVSAKQQAMGMEPGLLVSSSSSASGSPPAVP